MGLALAVIFLPLYLVVSIIAILSARSMKADRALEGGYELKGMVLATVATWALAYLARPMGYDDYGALLLQFSIVFVFPLLIGFFVSAISSYLPDPWFARITSVAIGAKYATVTMPWVSYLLLALIDWGMRIKAA